MPDAPRPRLAHLLAPEPAPDLATVLRDIANLLRQIRDLPVAPAPATLTAREMADYLGVSLATVERLKASGRLPAPVEIGSCHRWRRAEIEAWLAASCPPRKEWEARRR